MSRKEISAFNENMQTMMSQLNEDCMNVNASYDLKFNVLGETIHKMNSEGKSRYENLLNELGNMIIDVGTRNNINDADYRSNNNNTSKGHDGIDTK